jgi:hypothetical protein
MDSTTNNEETPRPEMIINLAKGQSEEEPEYAETPDDEGAWDDGDCYWDRVRECDADAYADSLDRD